MTARSATPRRPGRHRNADALTTAICLVGDHLVKAVSTATAAALATVGLQLTDLGPDGTLVPAASDRVIVLHLPGTH